DAAIDGRAARAVSQRRVPVWWVTSRSLSQGPRVRSPAVPQGSRVRSPAVPQGPRVRSPWALLRRPHPGAKTERSGGRSMSQSYTNLLVHIVFGTKHREPWLEKRILPGLFKVLGADIRELQGIPLEINGVADHVHILAKV